MLNENELIGYLEQRLSPSRFKHCIAVASTARDLALQYKSDEERAYLAGLAHDMSKWMDGAQMLAYARENGLETNRYTKADPGLLHANISGHLLKKEFHVCDAQILSAVENHICGRPHMSKLDAIVCLADWIEPGRTYEDIPALRVTAQHSLEKALRDALATTITVVLSRKKIVYPLSLDTYNWLSEMIHKEENLV